jgi:hypothetical protein
MKPTKDASMRNRRSLTSVALALLAALTACAGKGGHAFHDEEMDFGAVRVVAVMPLANLTRDNLAGERVRDVFANMLLASGAVYVVPQGEVMRGIMKIPVVVPAAPSLEEVTKLGQILKANAIVTGVVKEYGEVRSGGASGNVVSVSLQMIETATGKVVWSAASTKGGITTTARLFGGGGQPVNDVTEEVVRDLLDKLFE